MYKEMVLTFLQNFGKICRAVYMKTAHLCKKYWRQMRIWRHFGVFETLRKNCFEDFFLILPKCAKKMYLLHRTIFSPIKRQFLPFLAVFSRFWPFLAVLLVQILFLRKVTYYLEICLRPMTISIIVRIFNTVSNSTNRDKNTKNC